LIRGATEGGTGAGPNVRAIFLEKGVIRTAGGSDAGNEKKNEIVPLANVKPGVEKGKGDLRGGLANRDLSRRAWGGEIYTERRDIPEVKGKTRIKKAWVAKFS